ncbi:hypothetical protein IAG44_08265 [Streptomyces roseirectus]|uniref:Uncharacterized protein n=1 Tax=Streptomyces roseirectus TaxID=2768066 RepID=A0A7H0I9G8_9ACTN|nr:hypothetical protein [Streptomyces roseirectus]QNP69434.1 hypothetical protein IAG44_08265 [Streptomyces roseirectus]
MTPAVQAGATAGFLLADTFTAFVVAVSLAGGAARAPLIRAFGGVRPREFRAYQLLVVANVLALVGPAAVVLVRLPAPARVPVPVGGPRRGALRDRRYLFVTVLDGVMAVQFKVLTVALPLWLVGASMVTGTVIVVLFQVRASRGIAYRRAGPCFSCPA